MGSIPYLSWKLAKPNKALEHVWHPLNTILFIYLGRKYDRTKNIWSQTKLYHPIEFRISDNGQIIASPPKPHFQFHKPAPARPVGPPRPVCLRFPSSSGSHQCSSHCRGHPFIGTPVLRKLS